MFITIPSTHTGVSMESIEVLFLNRKWFSYRQIRIMIRKNEMFPQKVCCVNFIIQMPCSMSHVLEQCSIFDRYDSESSV